MSDVGWEADRRVLKWEWEKQTHQSPCLESDEKKFNMVSEKQQGR